jgi:hypothetical protein
MYLKLRTAALLIMLVSIAVSCSKGGDSTAPPENPCNSVSITVSATITDATSGQSNGSITATATGSTGFSYKLNNGVYQASGLFGSLAPGNYTVTARSTSGCEGSASFTVGTANACAGTTITINTTTLNAAPCTSPETGSIVVDATGSAGLSYSINGGSFQAGNTFSNLGSGTYTVTVKNAAGCSQTTSAIVNTSTAGAKFSEVKSIIQTNCVGCHSGAGASAGLNLAVDCNIILNKDKIRTRAVDGAGTSTQMPQPPAAALASADRQKITDWITSGGTFTN